MKQLMESLEQELQIEQQIAESAVSDASAIIVRSLKSKTEDLKAYMFNSLGLSQILVANIIEKFLNFTVGSRVLSAISEFLSTSIIPFILILAENVKNDWSLFKASSGKKRAIALYRSLGEVMGKMSFFFALTSQQIGIFLDAIKLAGSIKIKSLTEALFGQNSRITYSLLTEFGKTARFEISVLEKLHKSKVTLEPETMIEKLYDKATNMTTKPVKDLFGFLLARTDLSDTIIKESFINNTINFTKNGLDVVIDGFIALIKAKIKVNKRNTDLSDYTVQDLKAQYERAKDYK